MHLIASSFDDIVQFQIPDLGQGAPHRGVYALIYLLIRLAKRDAAQLTASDFVVVLLLSNVVQNAIIGPDNSSVGGAIGAVTLIVVNEIVARWEWARKMARADRAQQEERDRKPSPEPTGMMSSLWATRTDPVLADRRRRGAGSGHSGDSASRSSTSSPSCDDRASEIRAVTSNGRRSARAARSTTSSNRHRRSRRRRGTSTTSIAELRELRDAVGRLSTSG